jgi:hypothetical protein
MSEILQTVYASAPSNQTLIHTLTLEAPSLPSGVLRWVQGSEDENMGLEGFGPLVLYKALPFDVSLPDRSIRGNQELQFQLDNITGEALKYLNDALDAGDKIKVVYRVYLDSDKSVPAEQPIFMTATSMSADYKSVQVIADFHDFLNKAWPSVRYTAEFAPGLKYI